MIANVNFQNFQRVIFNNPIAQNGGRLKESRKSVANIWQRYGQKFGDHGRFSAYSETRKLTWQKKPSDVLETNFPSTPWTKTQEKQTIQPTSIAAFI